MISFIENAKKIKLYSDRKQISLLSEWWESGGRTIEKGHKQVYYGNGKFLVFFFTS